MEDEEEGEDSSKVSYDRTIMPEVVIALDASDDFLKDRIMNLPEDVVQVGITIHAPSYPYYHCFDPTY